MSTNSLTELSRKMPIDRNSRDDRDLNYQTEAASSEAFNTFKTRKKCVLFICDLKYKTSNYGSKIENQKIVCVTMVKHIIFYKTSLLIISQIVS